MAFVCLSLKLNLKELSSWPDLFDFLTDTSNTIGKDKRSDMASSDVCCQVLQALVELIVKKVAKAVVAKVGQTLTQINEIPELNEGTVSDQKVSDAVTQVKENVKTTFIHARSYIIKCHELADYVCEEERYTIKAVEEGNVEEFKNFFEEVLSKSMSCRKDLRTLIEYIETEENSCIGKQESKIEHRQKDVNMIIAAGAGIAVVGGGTTVASAGVAMAGLAGPQAVFVVPVGLGVALVSLYATVKGSVLYTTNKQIELYCEKAIRSIKEMTKNLELIEDSFKTVSLQLQHAIDGNLEMLKDELSRKSRSSKHIIVLKIKSITSQTKHVKDYCEPLVRTKSLEEFVKVASI